MSSVAVSSYSDLDARTEFVLNRMAFLDSVTEVLQHENTPENKQKVAVWLDNNYIPLIVRCIMDDDENIYDRAIWATGNLLVSDDSQVVAAARAAINKDILKILVQRAVYFTIHDTHHFTTQAPTIRNGIYYLLMNLSKYEMSRFFTEAINSLIHTVLTDKYNNMNPKSLNDFLETVKNIAKQDPGTINENLLIDALFNPNQSQRYSERMSQHYLQLFHIIGTLAEQDSMISPPAIHQLMTYFTRQLALSDPDIPYRDILWVLSNIMIEPSAPELFAGEHKELKNLVESIAWKELVTRDEFVDEEVGYDALFVLVNFIHGAKYISEEFLKNLANELGASAPAATARSLLAPLFRFCLIHHNPKVVAVAREGFELISQMIATFNPPPAEVPCDTSETESVTEYEDTETDTENDVMITIKNDVGVATCEKPVPSASDLVLGTRRGNESGTVRRVVSLLVNSPVGDWVEVPSDWTLTVSDLTTLQHLGYTIKDGYVGINPEVYCKY